MSQSDSAGPLAQSAERNVLLSRLGHPSDANYKRMLQEATAGRDRLSYDPANLTAQSRADVLVRAPYKWDQLSETAKHAEILRIYNMASPYTRYYYDKGRYTTQVYQGVFVDENWAIRWFLWHSFRYRDNRDTRAPRADSSQGFGGQDRVQQYFDPVHNRWSHQN